MVALLSEHLSLLAAHGPEATRALLQRTILDGRVRPVMIDRATGCTGPGFAILGADLAPATVVAYLL